MHHPEPDGLPNPVEASHTHLQWPPPPRALFMALWEKGKPHQQSSCGQRRRPAKAAFPRHSTQVDSIICGTQEMLTPWVQIRKHLTSNNAGLLHPPVSVHRADKWVPGRSVLAPWVRALTPETWAPPAPRASLPIPSVPCPPAWPQEAWQCCQKLSGTGSPASWANTPAQSSEADIVSSWMAITGPPTGFLKCRKDFTDPHHHVYGHLGSRKSTSENSEACFLFEAWGQRSHY